jgi:hypothetical protein
MPLLELPCLLSSLLLGQTAPLEALASRLKVEGGVDVYYGYNLNRPADGANFIPDTGTTAKRHDEFSINLATLGVSVEPEPVGLRLRVGYGTGMEVLYAPEPEGPAIGPDVWRFLQQASVSYAHGPLRLEAGVYPSHIGLEYLPSHLNWTYTRGWMGELSPYYQAGIQGTWRFSRSWSAQLHILNGWQTIGQVNRGKALGTQVAYEDEWLSVTFNTFIGEEGRGAEAGLRLFGDWVVTYQLTEAFSVAGTADVGLQRRPGMTDALWYAAALNGRVRLAPRVAVIGRAEFFDDRDGAISGTAQRLVEGTLTLVVEPAEHLVLKLEARHDRSTAEVFGTRGTTPEGTPALTPTQTLLVAGVTAYF